MSRLEGPLAKRMVDIEKLIKGVSHVEFVIMDKDTDEILREIKPDRKATYRVIFRI